MSSPATAATLLAFRGYLAPYRRRLGALVGLVLLTTATEGLGVGLLYPLIEYIQMGDAYLARGASSAALVRVLGALGLTPSIGVFMGLIFTVIAASLVLRFALWMCSAWIFNPLAQALREDGFREVLDSHLFYFYSNSSGALINTLEAEPDYLAQSFNLLILSLTHAVSITLYVLLLLFVSWRLTLIVAALGLTRYLVSGLFIRRINAVGSEYGELRTRMKGYLIGIHQGIDVVKSCGTEEREKSLFHTTSERITANAVAGSRVNAESSLAEGLLGDSLLCLLVFIAVSLLHLPMAALLSFLFVNSRIIPKITAVNAGRIQIGEYLFRVKLLPEVLFGKGLPRIRWGARPKESLEDCIRFEDVSFSYPGGDLPSLDGISLCLKKRGTLALVGESGSGKSTLARLLLRLFEPSHGRITVDGLPLEEIRRKDWTRLISVVSQDTFIFDDTVENNIRYGVDSCTEAEFRQAVRLANAEEFIEAMPEKEKTRLGERGVKLSGGQRQRISIARAFLRDSPILILDEATSAMDAVTEKLIQDALNALAKERTLLVIAHRFTTIRHADEIVVLDKGRIAESGTHSELVAGAGLYRKFHDLQVC